MSLHVSLGSVERFRAHRARRQLPEPQLIQDRCAALAAAVRQKLAEGSEPSSRAPGPSKRIMSSRVVLYLFDLFDLCSRALQHG